MSQYDSKFSSHGRREFLLSVGAASASGHLAASQDAPSAAKNSGDKKSVRVGLIGCGGRGSHLAQVTRQLSQAGEAVNITAVCDIYQPRLERIGTRFSAKQYSRSSDLVQDSNVDAVIVATPDRLHVYHSLEAVQAGKDVYCEKPLTHWKQFDELKQLVREVRRRKTVFQVGAQWVSDPIWTRAAEQIKKGAVGKVVHAQCGYFRHGDGGERGMPIDDPHAQPGVGLDWKAFQADAPKRSFSVSRFFQWRMYLDYSGGPVTDLYPHPLTRLIKALGVGLPKRVVAAGGKYFYDGERDVPDTFDLLIEYREGLTVSVLGTIVNDTGLDTVIRGSEGNITFSGDARLIFRTQPDLTRPRRVLTTDRYVHDHIRNFLDCIRTREKTFCDIELGYVVQVPLIMAMQSFVTGKAAFFDADAEKIRLS